LKIFWKGFCGIIFQTVFLREFFSVFYGTELSLVFTLSLWIIAAGCGSYLLKKVKNYTLIFNFFTLFENFFFILMIFLLRRLRHISYIQFTHSFLLFSFTSVFIAGFIEGARFVLLSHLFKWEKSSGRVYGLEAAGALTGGVLLPFFFSLNLNPFHILFITSIFNFLTLLEFKAHKFSFSFLFFLFFISAFFSPSIETKSLNLKWKPFKIIKSFYTPYQNIEIVKKNTEIVLSSNGIPEISNQPDYYSLKNIVFFSICFLNKFKNALIISNPEIIEEIIKYRPEKIYYVEQDKKKIGIVKKYFLKKNYENLIFIKKDPYLFLKKTDLNFDVIFIGKCLPLSLRENRKFTDEFVALVSRKVKIVSLILPGNYDYIGKNTSFLHSIIYHTFKKHFRYSKFIFSYPFISIYSNIPLNNVNKKMIVDKDFLNLSYLKYVLDKKREKMYIAKNIEKTPLNTLNSQYLFFFTISHFFSFSNKKTGIFFFNYFKKITRIKILTFILSFIFFIIFLFISKKNIRGGIIFTNGFVCFGYESLLIIITQITHGYIYSKISTVIALFMGGISAGAIVSGNFLKRKHLIYSEFLNFSFYTISFFLIYFLKTLPFLLLVILIFTSGFFVGLEFGIISGIEKGEFTNKTGKLYAFDLTGGAISSILIPILILPIFGLYLSFLIFPLVKFTNLIFQNRVLERG